MHVLVLTTSEKKTGPTCAGYHFTRPRIDTLGRFVRPCPTQFQCFHFTYRCSEKLNISNRNQIFATAKTKGTPVHLLIAICTTP